MFIGCHPENTLLIELPNTYAYHNYEVSKNFSVTMFTLWGSLLSVHFYLCEYLCHNVCFVVAYNSVWYFANMTTDSVRDYFRVLPLGLYLGSCL